MKKYLSLLFLLVFIKNIFSQSLIFPQFPSDIVTDLCFLNSNDLILINDGGGIYKSQDGGASWKLKAFYPEYKLNHIYFLNDCTGFITSKHNDALLYTKDLGEWNEQEVTTSDAIAVLPFSENILIKSTNSGIMRLNNFYNDWELVYQMPFYTDSTLIVDIFNKLNKVNIFDEPYGAINKFHQLPSGNVIAIADNRNAFNHNIKNDSLSFILNSKDSCLTWDTLWIGLKEFITDISFTDDQNGWMISDTSLFKTTNGGLTWQKVETSYDAASYSNYSSIYCKEHSVYVLTYGSLLTSTNSGTTWTNKKINVPSISSLVFNDDNNGYVLADELLKTTDAGQTWETQTPYRQINIFDMDFISTKEGIAISNNCIYKTYDGGHSWSAKFTLSDIISNDPGVLKMISESDGWLITYKNIYKTTDRGESWNNIEFPYKNLWFNKAAFYNANLAVINAAEESDLYSSIYDINVSIITTNGGQDWKKISSPSKYFTKLKFTDSKHLWGIGQTGMWVSYDTAATWKKIYNGDYLNGPFSFDFCDSLYGILTLSGNEAFLTSDGGDSWNVFNKPIYNNPSDCKIVGMYVTGSQRIMEIGNDGKIILTYLRQDGSVEYSSQVFSGTGMKLNTIDTFVEDDFPYVWIGGYGFSIVYRQYEKIVTDVERDDLTPHLFTLFQNYPNPFNPTTTINYQIPSTGHVSLKIYDILGREIATLVNEEKSAGNYEIKFDGSNLSSGVYFYRLQSGSFSETKKFVLLK
jgi:photosystem II stability/assembly factor-like uncharacterized protein